MSTFLDILSLLLAAIGGLLILVAGLGIYRLPDLLTRMHASSKAGTLGAVCILLAVALGIVLMSFAFLINMIFHFLQGRLKSDAV